MNKTNFMVLLEKTPDLNTAAAVRMIGGSAAIYEKVFKKIVKLIPTHSEEMKKYLFEDNDLDLFASKIHGMKSSLAQLGHQRLSGIAEMLEKAAKSGNATLCREYFEPFNTELMAFWETACCIISRSDDSAEAKSTVYGGSVEDFCRIISEAMEAAEDFECQKVSDLLSPILCCSFGSVTDKLLKETANSLEMYRPLKTSECLAAILEEYKNTPEWH